MPNYRKLRDVSAFSSVSINSGIANIQKNKKNRAAPKTKLYLRNNSPKCVEDSVGQYHGHFLTYSSFTLLKSFGGHWSFDLLKKEWQVVISQGPETSVCLALLTKCQLFITKEMHGSKWHFPALTHALRIIC